MDARKARTVGIFAALAIAWLLVVVIARAVSDGPTDPADPDDIAADPGPTESETATVHPTHDEACAALTAASPNIRVSEAKAMEDRDALADSILGGDVTMVGLTRCSSTWAVSVGVSTPTAVVPAFGPEGTPVVVTVAGPFYAF